MSRLDVVSAFIEKLQVQIGMKLREPAFSRNAIMQRASPDSCVLRATGLAIPDRYDCGTVCYSNLPGNVYLALRETA